MDSREVNESDLIVFVNHKHLTEENRPMSTTLSKKDVEQCRPWLMNIWRGIFGHVLIAIMPVSAVLHEIVEFHLRDGL